MEDRLRFLSVLDDQSGIGQWGHDPRWYRRCYQGLVRSYFTYDAKLEAAPAVGKRNWSDLRDYLNSRNQRILDSKVNPDWVLSVTKNKQLFSESPCEPYSKDLLQGDSSHIDLLCEQLGIVKSSWFLRELVLAQVKYATTLSHERFRTLIPNLIELIEKNPVLRDQGMVLMLDKYSTEPLPTLNEPLRNASVDWWGNPWLPSNQSRWGGVLPAAREMVSDWLKSEFIEAFFTKLAEDGVGDRRRANFWLRYVKSMDIRFALGSMALYSRDRDFEILRRKMKGLYTELRTTDSANNAFVMTLGDLVAVEFGGMGNALYGYDKRDSLPFDISQPVGTTVNARNSLKHKPCMLWLTHQDGIRGFNTWEEMFEATLVKHFNIRPDAVSGHQGGRRSVVANTPVRAPISTSSTIVRTAQPERFPEPDTPDQNAASAASIRSFSQVALTLFANMHQLKIDDMRPLNGSLWVRTDDGNVLVNSTLRRWGFTYKSGKGWWK